MVIYLKEELIINCQLNSLNPSRVIFFENIAIARRDGKHFLIGNRAVFNYLRNLPGLTNLAKSIYNRIYKRFATETVILSDNSFTFKIGITNSRDNNSLTFNINELNDDSFALYNNLLLENSLDTFIFEKAIDFYKNTNDLIQIDCLWDVRNGGGTTSYSEFVRLGNLKNSYTFAVLDSDKICPNSQIGGTASQFLNANCLFGNYHILDVHEIENLIPKQIYSLYINSTNDANLNNNLAILDSDSNIIQYLDIKKGIKKHKIFQSNQQTKQYYCLEYGIEEQHLNCGCISINSCNCFLFHPMSRTIFNIIKNFINHQNINFLDFITGFLQNIYSDLGQKLFWIFCKTNRITVN